MNYILSTISFLFLFFSALLLLLLLLLFYYKAGYHYLHIIQITISSSFSILQYSTLNMNLLRGSWNVNEDETPAHSPVRLLQKLAAYRATVNNSPTSSPSLSPSSQTERKSTILTESTNFFARLWRPNTSTSNNSQISAHSTILIASHEAASSSSFDHVPDPTPVHVEPSINLSVAPQFHQRRISIIRDVSPKDHMQLSSYQTPSQRLPSPSPPPPPLSPPLQTQEKTSSVTTDPSFEDTTSEHPCDTASEFHSQSFETNIDSSVPALNEDEQPTLGYIERQRRLSSSTKSVIPLVQSMSSHAPHLASQHYSDSLASPEANIDVSMVGTYYNHFLQY